MSAAVLVSEPKVSDAGDVLERLQAARTLARSDHRRGMAALNALFREGTLPPALNGRCAGELVALDIAPGLTPLLTRVTDGWLPWLGKTFDKQAATGDNVFERGSLRLAHILWPFYRGYTVVQSDIFRAFTFHTYTGPGLADPDMTVFKIDYDSAGNPGFSIRRIVDELVEIAPGVYLGKAHLHWWWGRRQMVAFFLLHAPT